MTEDTSPENLRKFLESDDLALVRMGLSMAKGADLPKELLPTILRFYMWDEDKTVRAAAKSVFTKWAPDEIQAKVKENWKPSYRSQNIYRPFKFYRGQKNIHPFLEAFKSQNHFAIIGLEPLTKALEDEDTEIRADAAMNLSYIGEPAIFEPLLKILEDKDERESVRYYAIQGLEKIGKRAIKPLIKALEDEDIKIRWQVAKVLGNIGNKRAGETDGTMNGKVLRRWTKPDLSLEKIDAAVEPLIKALEEGNNFAAEALAKIGDERAIEPLAKGVDRRRNYCIYTEALCMLSQNPTNHNVRRRAIETLEELGHEVE